MKTIISLKTKMLLLLAVTLWASAFVGIRAGLQEYTPGGLALLRLIIASLCMFIMQISLPVRNEITWRDKFYLLLLGIIGIGFYQIALNYGEIFVSAGITSFIISLSPLITLIFAVIFLREKVSANIVYGMLISVAGVALIMLSKTGEFNFHLGVLYVLAATVISGIYSVVQKPFLKKYHAMEVTAYIIWGATLFLIIYFPEMLTSIKNASLQTTGDIVYLGVFPATIGYIAWSYGLKEMPASQAVNYLYLMPIIATLLGWVWLKETPAGLALLGGLVALFGVWIVNYSKEQQFPK
jgi:drug/metabolite transporter (DMT)-like permease